MSFQINPAWALAVFLMACRLAGVLLLSPVLGFATLPRRVRVIFVLLMAMVLAVPAQLSIPLQGLEPVGLAVLAGVALLQGALVGAALRAAVAAFGFGGQLVDFQIGFNAAAILNPATEVQSSLVGTLLETLSVLLFLLLDLHHVLLRGLAEVFRPAPLSLIQPADLTHAVLDQSALIFAGGLALVMPVVVGLFLLDLTVAALSRSMPQINIYFVALPLKVFAGLTLVALSVSYLVPLSSRIFGMALSSLAPQAP